MIYIYIIIKIPNHRPYSSALMCRSIITFLLSVLGIPTKLWPPHNRDNKSSLGLLRKLKNLLPRT